MNAVKIRPLLLKSFALDSVHAQIALVLLAYLLLLPLSSTLAASAPEADTANPAVTSADNLEQIWNLRADDLAAFLKEMDTLRARAENLAPPLTLQLQDMQRQFTRLSSLYHASRGHPTEQLTVVQQMMSLRSSLRRSMAPLAGIAETLDLRLEEVARMQGDLSTLAPQTPGSQAETAGNQDSEGLRSYTRSLNNSAAEMSRVSSRLQSILAPAREAGSRFDQIIASIESDLPLTWQDYYLTRSGNNFSDLAGAPALFTEWLVSLDSRMGFAYPRGASAWFAAARSFIFAATLMALFGFLGLKGSAYLPQRWQTASELILRRSWIWIALGISLLSASGNNRGGMYFALLFLGVLALIGGIAAMSHHLRVAVRPELETQPSPLRRLFFPAAAGVAMLFSDLPTRMLGIIWSIALLIFIIRIISENRRNPLTGIRPLVELLADSATLIFSAASLFIALFGYARLAILEFMLLFALINAVILASALMDLFCILAEKLIHQEERPVTSAIAQAVSVPLAWLLALVCTAPWIWAVPGASYLVRTFSATEYDLGMASFNLSKILFIAALFFLFRSFSRMGHAYLVHLPERVPNVERGVIPPLRNIVTYGLWAVFALIALSLVGVSLTSLAVVAGGLSVGIGFGLQNLFNNLISGIMLIFGRTILVGDVVDVPGASGTVQAINIRSTVLQTADRALVYVPNSTIMSGQFTNWTRNGRMVRSNIEIGVAYGSDPALVEKLLLGVAANQAHVVKMPEPFVIFNNFGDNALNFTLYVFIDDLDHAAGALSAMRIKINHLFTEHAIEIPFPQLTLHMPEQSTEQGQEEEM